MSRGRWFSCPRHYDKGLDAFLKVYLKEDNRRPLLIGAGGFDPRCLVMPKLAKANSTDNIEAVFLRERRPSESGVLIQLADQNTNDLVALIPRSRVADIEIFAGDGHVNAGINIVQELGKVDFTRYSDVFLDVSSMSIGVSFPLARFLFETPLRADCQLHLLVASAHDPAGRISTEFGDRPGAPRGFVGEFGLIGAQPSATLWLPELAPDLAQPLTRIFESVQPDQTCPILPFPAIQGKEGDNLMYDYADQFEQAWEVDQRDIVYASGSDPHDLYRTLCKVNDIRKAIFGERASQLVVTPFGSKALAAGAMMAAMEHNLRISYLEAVRYDCANPANLQDTRLEHSHIWLT